MTLVAGIDSSTQSVKVLVCDAATGEVVREGRAGHPDGTECPPSAWWDALTDATHGLLDDVAAVSVAGQQHGMVLLDDEGKVVRPALLWNDTRSARAADDLVRELGGGQAWADAVGSVPLASFTVTKLRWVAEHEPEVAERAARVLLPHDWLTWRLSGESGEPVTDRGDASGTGYWSPGAGAYRHDLVELAFGRQLDLPRLAAPSEVVGHTKSGIALAAGTGDNMGAALALGLRSGDLAVSLGTSGTVFAVAEEASADGSGLVAGFADATGRYLPLACTLNAARVLTSTATMLEVDLDRLSDLALDAPAGADGLVLLPYLDGERTPNLPDATGQLVGLTRASMTRSSVARAAVEGMLCGLADAYDAVLATGVDPQRVLLVGGAARSPAVQHIAAAVLGRPITIPEPGEYVALGAARQAAWAIGGDADPPSWPVHTLATVQAAPTPHVREAYADAREAAYGR